MTSDHMSLDEASLAQYIEMIEQLARGDYHLNPAEPPTDRLGLALVRLAGELEKRQHEQNAKLDAINEAKNTFMGVAAHDLRSPLGIIEMATSIFEEPEFELSQEELATITGNISVQTRHMRNLIDNLLDFSRIERGKIELMPKLVDLSEFVTRAVDDHAHAAEAKGLTLHLESELDASDIIKADPMRLRQAVDNLLSNALKFSPLGSRIDVIAKRLDSGWRIAVKDEGPGLKPEEQKQLFQPFTRLSAKPTGGERGTGLGLVITRYIIHSHNGEIGVETEPGEGAQFWFSLPVTGMDAQP